MNSTNTPSTRTPKTQEADNISGRTLSLIGLWAVVAIFIVAALVYSLMQSLSSTPPAGAHRATSRDVTESFATPRLEPEPASEIGKLKAEKQALISSYQWVDKPAGVIRIPVARAMELLVQRQAGAKP